MIKLSSWRSSSLPFSFRSPNPILHQITMIFVLILYIPMRSLHISYVFINNRMHRKPENVICFLAAIQALKRKKRYEKQLQQIDGTLSTIEMQREALESANTNTAVLTTMKGAADAMKAAHQHMYKLYPFIVTLVVYRVNGCYNRIYYWFDTSPKYYFNSLIFQFNMFYI